MDAVDKWLGKQDEKSFVVPVRQEPFIGVQPPHLVQCETAEQTKLTQFQKSDENKEHAWRKASKSLMEQGMSTGDVSGDAPDSSQVLDQFVQRHTSRASLADDLGNAMGKGADIGSKLGAGTALVAGQLGPQVALPEELLTVPAGSAIGGAVGAGAGALHHFLKGKSKPKAPQMAAADEDESKAEDSMEELLERSQKMFKKERKEHPSLPMAVTEQICKDHMRIDGDIE